LIELVAARLVPKGENRVLAGEFEAAVRTATVKTVQELSCPKASNNKSIIQSPDIYFSDRMASLIEQVKILHQDRSLPVLIEGETGTGKEVIARLIHFGEGGTDTPFIDLNCAALAPSVFESDLFGYEAGAFTGGLPRGQKGKLDLAFGGTLFLDEITEMSLELQAKLLRVLQEKEFYRVGGLKKIKTDVRIICATNTDIENRMGLGAFRRDLFFRLNTARIHLAPLRQRKDEIIPLAESFLARFTQEKRKRFEGISKEASQVLISYDWPGNIRELKNIIEYAVVMYNDTQLRTEHLGPLFKLKVSMTTESDGALLPPTYLCLAKHTNKIILEALRMHNGNKTSTAKYLGMPIRTLYRRLERLSK
jgi:transcriptional regulator with PAS, ATPase and Fis domain